MNHHDPQEGLGFLIAQFIQDFMQAMHHSGLSRPQIHALLHIYHAGECQISEIGGLSQSSAAAASQLVDRLVQQGLVERSEAPHDRRVKNLRLTDQGLELINRGVTSNPFLAELMDVLTPAQRETVHTALGYLAEAGRRIHSSQTRKVEHHA